MQIFTPENAYYATKQVLKRFWDKNLKNCILPQKVPMSVFKKNQESDIISGRLIGTMQSERGKSDKMNYLRHLDCD